MQTLELKGYRKPFLLAFNATALVCALRCVGKPSGGGELTANSQRMRFHGTSKWHKVISELHQPLTELRKRTGLLQSSFGAEEHFWAFQNAWPSTTLSNQPWQPKSWGYLPPAGSWGDTTLPIHASEPPSPLGNTEEGALSL